MEYSLRKESSTTLEQCLRFLPTAGATELPLHPLLLLDRELEARCSKSSWSIPKGPEDVVLVLLYIEASPVCIASECRGVMSTEWQLH